jgi:release factor glutamine methyltransferase
LPADYQAGFKDFLGCRIDLGQHPLIPREETENWVAEAIREIKKSSQDRNINCLDLFAGSGCIGIAVLKIIDNTVCDFAEIDDKFLEQIKINLDLNLIDSSRYKIIKSNVFSNISGRYDFILANPPYVAEERVNELGADVKKHEPMVALMAGEQGMDFIKVFLEKASDYLNDNGVAYVEIDPQQKELIEEIINKNYSYYDFSEDQFGKIRVLRIRK